MWAVKAEVRCPRCGEDTKHLYGHNFGVEKLPEDKQGSGLLFGAKLWHCYSCDTDFIGRKDDTGEL